MSKRNIKNSSKTAVGGIIAALSIVMMLLTSIIPTLTYALPALSGMLLVIVVIDVDKAWATAVYFVVSILSILLLADKEAAVMYALFFGYYPIIKQIFESKLSHVLSWIAKFVVFNIAVIISFLIITFVLAMPFEEMEKYGKFAAVGLLGLGNVVFLIYDIALSRLITLYMIKWRKSFKRIFKF